MYFLYLEDFFLYKIQISIFLEDFSHLSLHDEPDGESDVRSGLSGLTVEGSHDVM